MNLPEASAVAVFYALVVGVFIYREIKVPDDDVDEGMSMHSLHHNGAGMAVTSHHEKKHESVDSSNQLADWAHRA